VWGTEVAVFVRAFDQTRETKDTSPDCQRSEVKRVSTNSGRR